MLGAVKNIISYVMTYVVLLIIWAILGAIGYEIFDDGRLAWIGFFIIVAVTVIFVLSAGYKKRCPNCKKLFALHKIGNPEYLGYEDENMKTINKSFNNDGKVTGTQEQWVAGKRHHYSQKYICKYCGEECEGRYSELKEN